MNFWQYLIEKRRILAMTSSTVRELAPEMSGIESRNFDPYYANEIEDLIADSQYNGFFGYGVFDDSNKLGGYITGYKMEDDEFDPEVLEQVNFHDQSFKRMLEARINSGEEIEDIASSIIDKTFHVVNFVIDKAHRIEAYKLLNAFLDAVRLKGYKYLSFDALEDTKSLFMRDQIIRTSRLTKNNLRVIFTHNDGESMLTMMAL
jgi:hypothetical protein